MKKKLLGACFLFLLVGCSTSTKDIQKFDNSSSSSSKEKQTDNKFLEEKIDMSQSLNKQEMNISEYDYKIPESIQNENNIKMLDYFEIMKKDFYASSEHYVSSNGKLDIVPYAGGYNIDNDVFLFMFIIVNVSGRDIEEIDFNLNLVLKEIEYPQLKNNLVKISSKNIGCLPKDTAMPYIARFEKSNLSISSEEFIGADFEGTSSENLVIRYKK